MEHHTRDVRMQADIADPDFLDLPQFAAECDKLSGTELEKLARRLRRSDSTTNAVKLGCVLSKLASEKHFESTKPPEKYLAKKLWLSSNKIFYLMHLYKDLTMSGVSLNLVKHVEWGRLVKMAGALSPENVARVLTVFENKSDDELSKEFWHRKWLESVNKALAKTRDAPQHTQFNVVRGFGSREEEQKYEFAILLNAVQRRYLQFAISVSASRSEP